MVEIRKTLQTDANEITNLSIQLGYNTSVAKTVKRINQLDKHPDNCAFVAIIENKVIGWIHGFYTIRLESAAFVEIAGLVVDINHRNRNIGKKLISEVLNWAQVYRVKKVKVRCNAIRTESHKFYEKFGLN